uniref:Trna-dihydrouridine synthase n=1 Tax=Tetraselmis sp. GSL018 TaxID=582737 RepID=A0A061SPC6_9CHLO
MMRATGCAGVMVGRACLGRPWLLAQARDALQGRQPGPDPPLAAAAAAAEDHCRRLARYWGSEALAVRQMRKFVPLYLAGFATAAPLRDALLKADSIAAWREALESTGYDPTELPSAESRRKPRLKGGGEPRLQRVRLPQGWLGLRDSDSVPEAAAEMEACEG